MTTRLRGEATCGVTAEIEVQAEGPLVRFDVHDDQHASVRLTPAQARFFMQAVDAEAKRAEQDKGVVGE